MGINKNKQHPLFTGVSTTTLAADVHWHPSITHYVIRSGYTERLTHTKRTLHCPKLKIEPLVLYTHMTRDNHHLSLLFS